jgi:tetratricopeptide (TPR) repeat protein
MSVGRKVVIAVTCMAFFAFAGFCADATRPVLIPTSGFGSEELHHASHSMPMTLLGQFRTNIDAYLWLKTVEYLHGGITYRPFTEEERARGMHEHEHDMGGFAGHTCGGPTLIPPEEKDWRGIFGNLERNLKPYRPGPARHSDPQELIPWYRIQTLINPSDVNAYATCAFFLADFAKEPEQALAFLKEGLKNNPNSPVLHEAVGQLYFEKWNNYEEAIGYLRKAIAVGKQLRDREQMQDKAVADSFLFLARAYRETGELREALHTAEEGMREYPNNPLIRSIHRVIKREIQEGENRRT